LGEVTLYRRGPGKMIQKGETTLLNQEGGGEERA